MDWTYIANGNTLKLESSRCTGCGVCIEVCPHGVFRLEAEGKASPRRVEIVNRPACMECGACAKNCAFGALQVRPGVGCAIAVLNGLRKGGSQDCSCGCGEDENCC